jgi:anti-anti-sigma regulatory factor
MTHDGGGPNRPADALAEVNRPLLADVASPGLFLTAAYCLLDTHTREITIASAGHPPLLLERVTGETEQTTRTGPAFGLFADATFEEVALTLQEDDRLLLYTDGVLDGGSVRSLTPEQLEDALAHPDTSGQEFLQRSLYYVLANNSDADRDDITRLLLQARAGTSVFDNASPEQRAEEAAREQPDPATLLYGETEDRTYFSIRGGGTWASCDIFHAATGATLDAERALTLDLSGCSYLDSTFLGTIHEMVVKGADGKRVVLQGVEPKLRHLFEELSMRQVLGSICEERHPLPRKMSPIGEFRPDSDSKHRRVLRAHEVLSSLSEHNSEQFRSVVSSLRKEIEGD